MKSNPQITIAILFSLSSLLSCQDKEDKLKTFERITKSTKSIESFQSPGLLKINSYTVKYNPVSSGYIKLNIEDGSTFEAKLMDGGSFSSINLLLNKSGVMFDTSRKEVVIFEHSNQLIQ